MKVKKSKVEGTPSRPQSAVGEHPFPDSVVTRKIKITTNTDGMQAAPSNDKSFEIGRKTAVDNVVFSGVDGINR